MIGRTTNKIKKMGILGKSESRRQGDTNKGTRNMKKKTRLNDRILKQKQEMISWFFTYKFTPFLSMKGCG